MIHNDWQALEAELLDMREIEKSHFVQSRIVATNVQHRENWSAHVAMIGALFYSQNNSVSEERERISFQLGFDRWQCYWWRQFRWQFADNKHELHFTLTVGWMPTNRHPALRRQHGPPAQCTHRTELKVDKASWKFWQECSFEEALNHGTNKWSGQLHPHSPTEGTASHSVTLGRFGKLQKQNPVDVNDIISKQFSVLINPFSADSKTISSSQYLQQCW